MKFLICFFLISAVIFSCAHRPYAEAGKLYKKQARAYGKQIATYPLKDSTPNTDFIGTTNFNLRKPNFVIIHHTAQDSCEQTLRTFTMVSTQVSAHYVICRDGSIHHMLNDMLRAWHAGVAKWGSVTDVNSSSIGIELDNNGTEPFSDAQINSLMDLLDRLKRSYNIPSANFIGHGDIAPGRKVDPSWLFPWKKLSDRGFGLWYGDTTGIAVPPQFNHLQALRIVGYDLKDSSAAMQSFKRHWMNDTAKTWGDSEEKILYQLSRKSME
jgi:N-acetylmuramoyl-L-alanine amidase